MKETADAKQRGTTNVDEHAACRRGVADRTERAELEWADAADLRAIAPEEIQLLAATGC